MEDLRNSINSSSEIQDLRSQLIQLQGKMSKMYSDEDIKFAYFSAIKSTGEGWNGEYTFGNNNNIEEVFGKEFEEWFEKFKNK